VVEPHGTNARITEHQERRILDLIDQNWPPLAPPAAALIDDAVASGLLVAACPCGQPDRDGAANVRE
jgi:hypothetical protein